MTLRHDAQYSVRVIKTPVGVLLSFTAVPVDSKGVILISAYFTDSHTHTKRETHTHRHTEPIATTFAITMTFPVPAPHNHDPPLAMAIDSTRKPCVGRVPPGCDPSSLSISYHPHARSLKVTRSQIIPRQSTWSPCLCRSPCLFPVSLPRCAGRALSSPARAP